jgi:hypothetical protein
VGDCFGGVAVNILTDLVNAVVSAPLLTPSNITFSGVTAGVIRDFRPGTTRLQEFVVIQAGTVTDGNFAFKLQESNDQLTNYTDVANGLISLSSANSNTNTILPFYRTKRWLKMVVTSTNVTSGGYFAATGFAQQHRPGATALVP